MDYGDKRTLPLAISAREIAEDICREVNSDAGERSFLGLFVCAGDAPTEEELRGAREKLEEFYRALVASGDREWERSHSYLFINDLQRRAAARLGVEKEWHYQARETEECPGCGDRVKPGVAVCKSCHAILNRDKALALGLIQPPPEVFPQRNRGAEKSKDSVRAGLQFVSFDFPLCNRKSKPRQAGSLFCIKLCGFQMLGYLFLGD